VEDLIRQGRVRVNGVTAVLGQRADPALDRIEVDGMLIHADQNKKYLIMNKPPGIVTSARDPEGRKTVMDLVGEEARVFPVGRLDMATEGLLLLTNDGELSHRMTHPSFEIAKTYVAEVKGSVGRGALRRLSEGVRIDEGRPARASAARLLDSVKGADPRSVVELTVHEGRKHVVRKMLGELGHPVLRLTRAGLGPLKLGRLAPGSYRNLSREEVEALYREAGL
jgi:23S rRNA pseudouridine2605 synthase